MALWDSVAQWFKKNAHQLVVVRLPDPGAEEVRMAADEAYFGLWLEHGFLQKSVNWFENHYPAVQVSTRLDVAGSQTTLTKLARPAEGNLGPGVWVNYSVSGLVPYRGGTVEIEAALSPLTRSSHLGAAVDILSDFSSLITPPLSEAITIAGKVTDGVQKLLSSSGDEIELGLHETFTPPGGGGESVLAPGHLAVIKATAAEVNPERLTVKDSRLHLADGDTLQPLEGFSYMLFRIEGRRERDDWRFERFDKLIRQAIEAHFSGDTERFEGYRNTLLAEVLKSPDLIKQDRFRVARALAQELEEVADLGSGATGEAASTLEEVVGRRAAPIDDPDATSPVSLRELLGNRP